MIFNFKEHLCDVYGGIVPYRRKSYDGFLNLANNELVHPVSEVLYQSFIKGIKSDVVRHYPYYQALIKKTASFFDLAEDQVLLSAGSDDAIKMVAFTVLKSTKRLILQTPNYASYYTYPQLVGAHIRHVDFSWGDPLQYKTSIGAVIADADPSVVVITNPNGITGYCLGIDEVKELADICLEKGHLFIIDEAYVPFNGFHHLSLLSKFDNLIIIRSFSKSFGLAGMRVAAIFSSPILIDYFWRWNGANPLSGFSLSFLEHCFENIELIEDAHKEIIECRVWFTEELRKKFKKWNIRNSEGNFVLI